VVGFFRERNTFHIIGLAFVAILAKLAYLLHPPVMVYDAHQGLLPAMLNRWYAGGGSMGFSAFIALLINVGCALYANAVVMGQRMFPKPSFMVAVCMVLMSSLAPEANIITAPLLLLPLFIYIYQRVTSLSNTSRPRTIIYNIGLAAGVGTLLYHPFAILILATLGGIASMRTFRIQEWLIWLLGLITPYYLYLSWQFLKGYWHPQDQLLIYHLSIKQFSKDVYSLIAAGAVLVWTFVGIGTWRPNLRRMLIQQRKSWALLLLMVGLVAFMLFLKTGDAADSFALAVFPFSCFAASAFIFPKKLLWPNLLYWLVVFVIVLVCLRHYDGQIV
jgi:hypothetical protein